MSDRNGPPSPPPQHRRRSSFVDMFNPRGHTMAPVSSSPPSAAVPPSPNVPQHRRGTSITALGLTTNPSAQPSPFTAFQRQRRASIATSTSSSPEFKNSFGDEAVVEEDDPSQANMNAPPSPSFARRVSFGAQAMRDVRLGGSPGASGGGRRPSSSLFTLDENSENTTPSRQVTLGTATTAGKSRGLSFSLFLISANILIFLLLCTRSVCSILFHLD